MPKSIKVSDKVYQALRKLQRPRETFSVEIARLLEIYDNMSVLRSILEGTREYAKWRDEQDERAKTPGG